MPTTMKPSLTTVCMTPKAIPIPTVGCAGHASMTISKEVLTGELKIQTDKPARQKDVKEAISKVLEYEMDRAANQIQRNILDSIIYGSNVMFDEDRNPDICPYCQRDVQQTTGAQIYPKRPDLADLVMFACWPCAAWVGATPNGKPRGHVAQTELREARAQALNSFEQLNRGDQASLPGEMAERGHPKFNAPSRSGRYQSMNIGYMTVEECNTLVSIADQWIGRKFKDEVDAGLSGWRRSAPADEEFQDIPCE